MRLLKYMWKQKEWYSNMRKIIINYRHMGEANSNKFLHMENKCRLDRVVCYNRVWRFR